MQNRSDSVPAFEVASGPVASRSLRGLESKNASREGGLCCELVKDFAGLEQLSPEWERLWESDGKAEIFQTFAWARAWWQAHGSEFTICSPVVFEGDRVVGILPLARRGNIVQFLGLPEADYADMLCEEGREAEVLGAALGALFQQAEKWDECIFRHLAKESRVVRYGQKLPRKLRGRVKLVPAESYQTILLGENRDEIFSSLLGKHHTRRRQNKLKKAGQVTLRRLLTKAEALQHLEYFFLHHTRRCALLGRESTCAQPEFRQFLRALVEEVGTNDRLRFEVMELDGRPFAWHFSFLVNGKFLLYQHTFDLDSWDYAPGEVLLNHLFQFAQENVPREFDFGAGDEAYKNRFARHTRETFSLYVEPAGVKGVLRGWLRVGQSYFNPLLSRLKQRAKARSNTFRRLRSVRIWIAGVMSRIRQARKDDAMLRYGIRSMARVVRKAVWNKEERSLFLWESFVAPDVKRLSSPTGESEVEIRTGRFGDMVDLAIERPDAVVANELPHSRQALKKGDQIYIGRKAGRLVLLAWTSTDNAADISSGKPGEAVQPVRPALAVYDSWTDADHSDESCRELISVLRREAVSKKLDLMIRCAGDQAAFRTELERQGFLPQCRSVRYSLFYWFRWTRSFHTEPQAADPLLARAVGT